MFKLDRLCSIAINFFKKENLTHFLQLLFTQKYKETLKKKYLFFKKKINVVCQILIFFMKINGRMVIFKMKNFI